jgi:epoxyqueuosine reductase QueG
MTVTKQTSLEDQIKKIALDEGAALVGICSAENIKDFSEANFLLPGAQSIVSIAIDMNDEIVKKYLSKEDYLGLCHEMGHVYKDLCRIGDKIKELLEEKGFHAFRCNIYRNVNTKGKALVPTIRNLIKLIDKEKDPNTELSEKEAKTRDNILKLFSNAATRQMKQKRGLAVPNISHRRAAVASGLGRVGWSGNVITEKYGARVLFGSILTDAKLTPDTPLKNNPCVNCKLCEKSCQGGLFAKDETETIKIGDVEETIGKRYDDRYCNPICSGMLGQNKFKEWSTWSPFRLDDDRLPLDDSITEYVGNLYVKALEKGGKEAGIVLNLVEHTFLGRYKPVEDNFRPTCSCCQLVCGPDIKNKKESYNLLINSGCVVQKEDGSIEILEPK